MAPIPKNHVLCFLALADGSEGYAFACDAAGQVNLDGLTERERIDYLYARAVVGREVAPPAVISLPLARRLTRGTARALLIAPGIRPIGFEIRDHRRG